MPEHLAPKQSSTCELSEKTLKAMPMPKSIAIAYTTAYTIAYIIASTITYTIVVYFGVYIFV